MKFYLLLTGLVLNFGLCKSGSFFDAPDISEVRSLVISQIACFDPSIKTNISTVNVNDADLLRFYMAGRTQQEQPLIEINTANSNVFNIKRLVLMQAYSFGMLKSEFN